MEGLAEQPVERALAPVVAVEAQKVEGRERGFSLAKLGERAEVAAPVVHVHDRFADGRCQSTSRVLKKSVAWGRNREHNGIQSERNRTAAEMSFSTAC